MGYTSAHASPIPPSHRRKKRAAIGPARRGEGTKIVAVADRTTLPLVVHLASASPADVSVVNMVFYRHLVRSLPERLIGDKIYASDPLDRKLKELGVETIAPNRAKRRANTASSKSD